MSTSTTTRFEQDSAQALDRLRAALIELFDHVGADPGSPQDIARRFSLNKNLTWKLSKVIGSANPMVALGHVPGTSAMGILLRTMEAAGASDEVVGRVRRAMASFDEMVEVHVGDRTTLELVLDGMSPTRSDRLEVSRKLAFRGNSGIFGVQARTKLSATFLAPNKDDPSKLDMAMVRGFVGFRRLRPTVSWPLFRIQEWSDGDDAMVTRPRWEAITPEATDDSGACMMMEFTSERLPSVVSKPTKGGRDLVLMPGAVGNFGAIDCFQGDLMRAAVSRYRVGDEDPVGELGSTISVPVEQLVFDLIVHHELEYALTPQVVVFGRGFPHDQTVDLGGGDSVLPIHEEPRRLAGSPPVVTTPLVPKYTQIFQRVADRLGYPASDFRAVRLKIKYPPLGSTVMLRFDLPEE